MSLKNSLVVEMFISKVTKDQVIRIAIDLKWPTENI
jgi:hypothetical protein